MKENNNKTNNQSNSTELNSNNKYGQCFLKKICCPKFFSSKIFIAIVFTIIGICSATLAQNIAKNNSAITANDDIFKELAIMERHMDDVFLAHQRHIAKIFDESYKNNNATANKTSVLTREDGNNYYYDLSFSGFKKEDIKVAVKDNNLTFSAEQNQNKSDKNQKLKSSTNFYYTFSLPEYNAKIDPEIVKQDDKITVKLVKNSTQKLTGEISNSKK